MWALILPMLACALAAGCTAGPAPTVTPTSTPAAVASPPPTPVPTARAASLPADAAGASCPEFATKGRQVRFTDPARIRLAGVLLGRGRTGVVLAHQSNGTVCQWLPYGLALAERGYRVLVVDFAGHGASGPVPGALTAPLAGDMAAATGYLRGQGVSRVVLVGASMGGTAVVAAGASIRPPVAAVVCLSGPRFFQQTDAYAAARRLAVPVLYVAGADDSPFVDDVRAMYAATPRATGPRLVVVAGSPLHGISLVGAAGDATANAALDAFLAAHAPPR